MKASFNQHIGIFEESVPHSWCDKVINFFEDNLNFTTDRQNSDMALSIQKSDTSLLKEPHDDIRLPFFENLMNNIFSSYDVKYNILSKKSINEVYVNDFKTQKTLPSEGYHMWHYENSAQVVSDRIAVWTVYLNDVHEGGETEFLHQSIRIKPKKGTVCIFPAAYTHMHRGNPPLSGEKYIATGWFKWTKPEQKA